MGNTSIKDHIARYKILINKAGIQKNSPATINYFRKSLNVPLQNQLQSLPTPLTTLDEWTEWASRLDNNYWKMLRIFGRTPNNKKEELKRHWHFQKRERDPNTMDVDAGTGRCDLRVTWPSWIDSVACTRFLTAILPRSLEPATCSGHFPPFHLVMRVAFGL